MNRITLTLIVSLISLTAVGCGGSTTISTQPENFSGTVSTTSGIVDNLVELKRPNGEKSTATIADSGEFILPDAMLDDSYLMRVDLGNNNYLYSIAHLNKATGNRQNIHSYTDLVARTWFADREENINSVFASDASIENFPSTEQINAIDANVQAIVSDVLEVYGLSDVKLSDASYAATDTGIDRFLNENPVIIKNNRATIIVNDPQTNMQSIAVNRVRLQTTFSETDVTPPQQPQNLRALGASLTDIALSWTITSDNIAIATYDVYRNDEKIAHTPFPVYRDSNLQPNTDYSYTIVARDEAGNSSTPSVAAIAQVLEALDTQAPEIPSRATVEAGVQDINIYWSHNNINDIDHFEVNRTGDDRIIVREVTSTRFNDISVASGTEYCYTVVAVDASGNFSEPNPSACVTTAGAMVDPNTETTNTIATIEMAQETISNVEGTTISAFVNRIGDPTGEISVDYIITPGTAAAVEDYISTDGTLVWADGDSVAKQIDVELRADSEIEENETFSISLTNGSDNAVITKNTSIITIVDSQ